MILGRFLAGMTSNRKPGKILVNEKSKLARSRPLLNSYNYVAGLNFRKEKLSLATNIIVFRSVAGFTNEIPALIHPIAAIKRYIGDINLIILL